jgi:uncharacterized membrane protein YdfJ with MMPL/SSD domain
MGFEGIAALTWRHPRKTLGAIGLFMVMALLLGGKVEEHLQAAGFSDPDSESELAVELLREQLGYDASPAIVVHVSDPGGERLAIGSAEVREEVSRIAGELEEARFVARVEDPLARLGRLIERSRRAERRRDRAAERIRTEAERTATEMLTAGLEPGAGVPDPRSEARERIAELPRPPRLGELTRRLRERSPLVAEDGRSVLITGHLLTDDPENDGGSAAEDAERLVDSERLETGLSGFAVGFNEVEEQTRRDLTRAELIAFPALALLLLVVFRGVVAAAVPLLVGLGSILGTFLALRVMSELTPTSLFALNITTALSLGLAVDYALLMISRYREELAELGPTREAHRRMVTTAGRTVFFSGITVAAALVALVFFPQRFLYSVGAAGAMVGLLASTIAILGVSSMLAILGERINLLSVRRGPSVSSGSDGWYRLAHGVMRRPALVAVVSGTVMLAAAAPSLSTVITGPSAEAVPPGQPSFAVQEGIDEDYGRDVAEPITVTLKATERIGDRDLRRLNRRIGNLDGIATRNPFERTGGGVAYASFAPAREALAAAPQDAVRAIRELTELPGGDETELLVSGNTARFLDQKASLRGHLPLVAGVSVALTLFLLFMLTGSVILPIKTLLMNVLTMAAVLGILTVSFHDGWLAAALGYEGPEAIELMTLTLVFAITFGLATDYAVLVMARIKEQHDRGMPNREAVAVGIGRTGRVITAAAACLAVVFLAFATSEIFFMKQAAIGQAAGVLIDATIVRALLVPSLMALFGELNWWAPGPLRRFQARWGFREA